MSGSTETKLRGSQRGKQKCQKSTRGDTTGSAWQRSPTTQTNVTVANQFTVNCNGLRKQAERTLAFHLIYHSCRAIPIFWTRNLTISSKHIQHLHNFNFITQKNQLDLLTKWTKGPQDHHIYLESTFRSIHWSYRRASVKGPS